jgi:putative PIN family toxin of toxin-antitoxin system
MVQEKKKVIRVVLDTNVLVSVLLFGGSLTSLMEGWKQGSFIPIFSRATFQEFATVLTYPKFNLARGEIAALLEEEVLPFFEVVEVQEEIKGVCRDPEDDKFIACALAGSADWIVSGDPDLLALKKFRSLRILKPSDFIRWLSLSGGSSA